MDRMSSLSLTSSLRFSLFLNEALWEITKPMEEWKAEDWGGGGDYQHLNENIFSHQYYLGWDINIHLLPLTVPSTGGKNSLFVSFLSDKNS